MRAYAFLVT